MSLEQLLDVLRDESQPIPSSRLLELSDLDAQQLEILTGAWHDLSDERRREILHTLGRLADVNFSLIFEPINRFAILDPDPEVRRTAIDNLWECDDQDLALPLLTALTSDPDAQVRAAAAKALGHFTYLGELDQLPHDLLITISDRLLQVIADDEDQTVRRHTLASLGYSSRTEVPAVIQQAFGSGIEEMQQAALLAMGRSANQMWADLVLSQLHNPAPPLRAEAARAAGELEIRDATNDLVDLLADVEASVRLAAAWGLGQLGGPEATAALSDVLTSTENPEEAAIIQDAIDHCAFVDGTQDFLLFDFDDPEDLFN